MSWLQVYNISVPYYDLRSDGKYVFHIQLQRRKTDRVSLSSTAVNYDNIEEETRSERDVAGGADQTAHITALRSYSEFRAVWKELLAATKVSIASSALATASKAAFVRRNRQTHGRASRMNDFQRDLAWLQQQEASSTKMDNSGAAGRACPCSGGCCPFSRFYSSLKSFSFPSKLVINRNSQSTLEARRQALETFLTDVHALFDGFPRSFLHSVESNERCLVLDTFASFIGCSDELRSMAISRSPLRVPAWKEDSRAPRGYTNGGNMIVRTSISFSNDHRSNQERESSCRTYAPWLTPWSEMVNEEIDDYNTEHTDSFGNEMETDNNKQYRNSSVYIQEKNRPSRSVLPKLHIRSAKVNTIRSFLVDFRDQLLTQSRTTLNPISADSELSEDQQWEVALYVACQIGHVYAVESILFRGTNCSARVKDDTTPLHAACHGGHVEIVALLIQNDADVNAKDVKGMTPLLTAVNNGNMDVINLLLNANANVNLCNVDNFSAIHVAVASQSLPILRLLLSYDAFVNTPNCFNGKTPLHIAAEIGSIPMCELLLKNGANVHQCDGRGLDAITVSMANGHIAVADFCRNYQRNSVRVPFNRNTEMSPFGPSQQLHVSTVGTEDISDIAIVLEDGHSYAVL